MNSTSSHSPFRSDLTPQPIDKAIQSSCCNQERFKNQERSRQDERLQDPSETPPRPDSSSHAQLHFPVENRQSSLRLFPEIREEEDTWRSLRPQSRRRRHRFRQIQGRQSVQGREHCLVVIKIEPVSKRGQRSHAREASLAEGQEFRGQDPLIQTDQCNQQLKREDSWKM